MKKCKRCKYYYEQSVWAFESSKDFAEMCALTSKPIAGILKCNGFEEGGKEDETN